MTTLTVFRVGLFALTIVALGFVPGVSVAKPASATGNGDFQMGGELRTFSFSAIRQPKGNVAGRAELQSRASGAVISMAIDCLNFPDLNAPNKVVVSGKITNSNVPTIVGQTATFAAIDNGEGSHSSPDRLSLLVVSGDCNSPPDFNSILFDIQHGDIQVRP
jgi:hypothetical protein